MLAGVSTRNRQYSRLASQGYGTSCGTGFAKSPKGMFGKVRGKPPSSPERLGRRHTSNRRYVTPSKFGIVPEPRTPLSGMFWRGQPSPRFPDSATVRSRQYRTHTEGPAFSQTPENSTLLSEACAEVVQTGCTYQENSPL
jgi:hypothetical protein